MSFAKLDSGIIDSSLWSSPDHVRIVWIAILAKKDQNGLIKMAPSALRRLSNLTDDPDGIKFIEAINVLESPDPESRNPAFNGRRIEKIEGGWKVLNHSTYREKEYNECYKNDGLRVGYVYFAGHGDRIKIGFSSNPWSRVNELKAGNPEVKLYSTIKGTMSLEKELHEEFKHIHIDREWFYLKEDLNTKIFNLTNYDILKNIKSVVTIVATNVDTPYVSVYVSNSLSLEEESEKEFQIFDTFVLMFPGQRLSSPTEMLNFKRTHVNYKEYLPKLIPAIKNQINWRLQQAKIKPPVFIPAWKSLKNWQEQKCWEEEKPSVLNNTPTSSLPKENEAIKKLREAEKHLPTKEEMEEFINLMKNTAEWKYMTPEQQNERISKMTKV